MKEAWEKWKAFAVKAGDVQVGAVFSFLYFLILVPTGFITSFFTDFFDAKRFPRWRDTPASVDSIEKLRQQ